MGNVDTPDMTSPRAPAPPRFLRRVFRTCAKLFWLLVALPVIFAAVVLLMVIGQDVTVPSWVKTQVSERAETALSGGALTFENISLNIGNDLHPRLTLLGVRLTDAEGVPIARIEQVNGLMSPRGVLFERRALLQDVTVSGMSIDLRKTDDGAVAFAFGGGDGPLAVARGLEDAFAQIDAAFALPAFEALERVQARGIDISYGDAASGVLWRGRTDRLSLDLTGAEDRLTADIRLDSVGGATFGIDLEYRGQKDSPAAEVTVAMDQADLAHHPALTQVFGTAPVTARAQVAVDGAGRLQPGALALDLAPGQFKDGAAIEAGRLRLEMAPGSRVVAIKDIAFVSDKGVLSGTGQIIGRADQRAVIQLALADARLSLPALYDQPMALGPLHLDARIGRDPMRLDIGALTLQGEALAGQARGWIERKDGALTGALDLSVPQMSRAQLFALWPENAAPGARRWLSGALVSGQMQDITASFRQPEAGPLVWSTGFDFSGAQMRVFRDAPLLDGGEGHVNIHDGIFGLTVARGHIDAPDGGRIDLAGSTLSIPDMATEFSPMHIAMAARGSVTAALSTLDKTPVRAAQRMRIAADAIEGSADVTAQISFPRRNPVPPDEVTYTVDAALQSVRSAALVPDRRLQARALQLQVDNAGLTIEGRAELDGVPLDGRFDRQFAERFGTVTAEIELSPQTMRAFNIDLPSDMISGRGRGALTLSMGAGEAMPFTLRSDLRGIGVAVPPIGWSKAPSTAGALQITGELGAQPDVTDLRISGGGLTARGAVSLRPGGGLDSARFSQLRIGDWYNAPLTLRGRGAGRPPAIEVAGGGLDLRRARFGAGGGGSGPLELALDRLQITEGIALTNFRGSFNGAGGFNGAFTGNLNGGPQIAGTVVPQNGRSAVRLRSSDAGGIGRAAGLLTGGTGGSLDLVLTPAGGEGTFDGTLAVRDFRLREAPTMAALLDAISVVGLLQQLDGQGLSFTEVDARFRLTPDRVILTESSAVGPGLGISLDGVYALASKQLDFQGVISPLYLINGIGSILTRKGEGLIGFNFTVGGTASAPRVGVNPLSALTPGMFREIFRRAPPEVGQ